jgi:mono/diheme cytochrome c family protein
LIDDPNWIVRRQLAASIGELPVAERLPPAVAILQRYGSDPITVDATISGLRGVEAEVLGRLLTRETTEAEADAIAMLTGAVARSGSIADVQRVLDRAGASDRPLWQRLALLRGLDAGLSSIALPAEPTALTGLAAGSDEMAAPARAVTAKLDWPGKPAPVVEPPALTPEQKARFEAGRQLYGSLCVACHQPDGAGREQIAPSLVGSALLVGDPGIPTRVLLGGMEGSIGLMPPLTTLTDEQIAAVLTYARREWGNTASAVEPEQVRETRGLTQRRTRPWTKQELSLGGR